VGRRRSRGHVVMPQPATATATFGAGAPATAPPAAAPTFTAPPPQWQRAQPKDAEAIADRLRQLDQLKQSGLLDDAAYAEQRKRILGEL